MNPAYVRARDGVVRTVNDGVTHPNDFEKVVELFGVLLDFGFVVDHPDQIHAYLIREHGMRREAAQDIQMIYEVLHARTFSRGRWWNEGFINELRRLGGSH